MPSDSGTAHPPERIDSGAAILRRWRRDDLDACTDAVLASREHLMEWLPWAANVSREGQAEFLEKAERLWESGAEYQYAMIVSGAIAGAIALHRRIGPDGLEIGYWVHVGHTRQGLATAGSAAATTAAFALPGIERVQIVHDEMNVASARVPAKLGFEIVARRRLEHKPLGGIGNGVVWEVTRGKWRAAAP
jgi:RimJ/RimL family protein N-acetyltransferase